MASKKLNIPIVLINKEKYQMLETNNNLSNYESEYTLMSYMESSAREKRSHRINK